MICWVMLDALCLAPLGLTTKGLNQKVENATLKAQCCHFSCALTSTYPKLDLRSCARTTSNLEP